MTSKGIEMGLVLLLVAMLWGGAAAQSSCTSVLMSLSPCLNYVTGNSSSPSASCCSQLANVVKSQPQCLCSLMNGNGASGSLGIAVNRTLALGLPGVCNVQTPPISQCNAATGPTTSASSPTTSPADSSDQTPEETPITPSATDIPSDAGTESKKFPSIEGGSSDGGIIKSALYFRVFLLFITSWASTGTGF